MVLTLKYRVHKGKHRQNILYSEDKGIFKDFQEIELTKKAEARINKWNCIKLKSFCISKEMMTRIKRPPE